MNKTHKKLSKKFSKFSAQTKPLELKAFKNIPLEKTPLSDPKRPLPYRMKITYPLNHRELILKVSLAKRGSFKAKIHITNHSGTLTLRNVQNEEEAEFCLHELNELAIADVIEAICPNVSYFEALENVAHFLNSFSLNQYWFIVKLWNPFKNYVLCDKSPSFGKESPVAERKTILFGKGKKPVEKSGLSVHSEVLCEDKTQIEEIRKMQYFKLEEISSILQKLYEEGIVYQDDSKDKVLLAKVHDTLSFALARTKFVLDLPKDKQLSFKKVFRGCELSICLTGKDARTSRLDMSPFTLKPEKIEWGMNNSPQEVILAFLHEIGHFLTHNFIVKSYSTYDIKKWFIYRSLCEIVAWKKALELAKALNIALDFEEARKTIKRALKSHFYSNIEIVAKEGFNIDFTNIKYFDFEVEGWFVFLSVFTTYIDSDLIFEAI